MKNNISILSRFLLIIATGFLVYSVFVPIWQIDLDAPQYPEGLNLKIHANKLAGNVDIINGLNHYIGMKTLHTDDFIEFKVLPYIIYFFAGLSLLVAIFGKKKFLYTVFTLFVLFGIVAMVDFWHWEYEYGHDLDPNAAIIVPGMAYQPPLIGFKQLLNFGAYSIPDLGGWLFISSGLLMLVAVLKESEILKKFTKKKSNVALAAFALTFILTSCGQSGPEKINLNKDDCDNCKMSISDKRFACELVTEKGRVYKFDDISCLVSFNQENKDKTNNALFYIQDYITPNELIQHSNLIFITGENVNSPMGGNIAAFSNKDSAEVYKNKWEAAKIDWTLINK
ncbi:MAG: nitrous oxide reductase accessory protein NosL [Bacteroidetes bacterium]|nr:nitrous oxide reductase accessory protein NosL [Bacteroidota bacterium]